MLKKIVYFNSGLTSANFTENDDGSITKSALLLVEGSHRDNKNREWSFDKEFILDVANNTNSSNRYIPVLKDHIKTVDSEVGEIADVLTAREVTEEDLVDKRQKHLIGKLGLFCDGVVIKAKDIVEKVKSGLARTISPGVDTKNRRIVELSLTPTPSIAGLSLFTENTGEMDGIYTLDDADAISQDEEELKEEFEELSYKFYCVMKNIMKSGDELGEEADVMVEKAFADYQVRLRDLFGLTGEIPDEDVSVADTQRNGYSLQQAPGMVQNDYAPYSLYAVDSAEFAGWFGKSPQQILDGVTSGIKQLSQEYTKGASSLGKSVGKFWKTGDVGKSTSNMKRYFTRRASDIKTGTTGRIMDWGRVGKAAGAVAGTGAAGYGAYRLGRAGLGAVGIGRKEDQKRRGMY